MRRKILIETALTSLLVIGILTFACNVQLAKTQQEGPTPVVLNNPTRITDSSVLLTWSRNTDNDFNHYQVLMSLEPVEYLLQQPDPYPVEIPLEYFEIMVAISDQSVTSYQIRGLSPSTTYFFVVATYNRQGMYSYSNMVIATTTASGPIIAITWSLDTILMVSLVVTLMSAFGLALHISKRSSVESTIICAIVGVFLSIVLRPNLNYPPLNFLVFGAVLGGIYGWIIYAIGQLKEGSRLGPRWHTVIGGAVFGGFCGLHPVLFWVFACCGIFVCIHELLFSERAPRNAGRLYVALSPIFGSMIAIFAFYLLRGYVLIPGKNPVVFPVHTETIIILGTIVGAICGLIPVVNVIYAFIFGLIIGFYSRHLAYSLAKPFFMIPLFLFSAYIIADRMDKKYEHTNGSRVSLVILFALLTSLSLLWTSVQRLDWQWGFFFAVILWFPAGVALAKIIAWSQKQEKERQKLQKEQQKIISSLSKIETGISLRDRETQELRQKHQEPLKRRNELEKEISLLVASDPANLTLKAEELRKQVKTIPRERIFEKMREIDGDIDGIKRVRRENEKRLTILTKEKEKLDSQLRETEKRLRKLEMDDTRNIQIALEVLRKKWQGFSQSDLEGIKVSGEVARLFKAQCLSNFRIEAKNREIESVHNKIRDTYRDETLTILEKLTLEEEEIIKSLGQDEPRLIEIGNELEKLNAEQLKLTKEKSRISQILAEMQMAKPRLKVPKVIYLIMGVALIVSLLLNTFSYGFIAPPHSGSETLTLKWSYSTEGLILSFPVIDEDGIIYVSSRGGTYVNPSNVSKLYTINPDGSLKWVYTFPEWYLELSPPAIDSPDIWQQSKTIYVALLGPGNKLYAINPNGTLKWIYTPTDYSSGSGPLLYPPRVGKDRIICVSFGGGKIYAVDPDGALKWTWATLHISNSPAIGPDGLIYVSSWSSEAKVEERKWRLDALSPDGTSKWSYYSEEPIAIEAPALGADGVIYIGGTDMGAGEEIGKLYAINPDGTLKWSRSTNSGIWTTPVISSDGTIYVGSYKELYAFSSQGHLKWAFTTGDYVSPPAIGEDGTIYVSSFDRKLYVINPDGILKSDYDIGTAVRTPTIGPDGTIYVGAGNKLYAFG